MAAIGPETWGRLYREHAPALLLYARACLHAGVRGEGAEDLVQEAFVKLAQQTTTPGQVLPWLYRVVRNDALQAGRGRARRRRREARAGSSEAWFASTDDQLDAQHAARLLAELPLEQREVIVARLWGGLTFEEVALLTGCALATAHRRYQAGLAALKERLEGRCTHTTPTTT
jgi:RNA polymerase sigma-70 factor (ECF subfamily)